MKPLCRTAFPILTAAAVACIAALAAPAGGEPISFDSSWVPVRFPHLSENEFELGGDRLDIRSDDSVSFVVKILPERLWRAKTARWKWAVDLSVPPTDLSQRGGDDRNITIIFLFMPEQVIRSMKTAAPRKLLMNKATKIISVVWGGVHPRGAVIDDPFAEGRGKIIALRPGGTGSHAESFHIASGHAAVFGSTAGALVAIAVGSDSDDTDSKVRASVTGLRLN